MPNEPSTLTHSHFVILISFERRHSGFVIHLKTLAWQYPRRWWSVGRGKGLR